MKPLIVANWKMNPASPREAKQIFNAIKKKDFVLCPPFVYLPLFKGITLGAQDCFFEEKGAYTGEVSAPMLKDLGVVYVIVGHSERRKYFKETNEIVNKKVRKVISSGLKPIMCIGETKEEKDQGQKASVLSEQIEKGLDKLTRDEVKKMVIAYEPVWAIGTGDNCSVDETMKSILFIRQTLSKLYNREIADSVKIIYGGSVNSENSASYIKEAGSDGLLVGGASLKPEEFLTKLNQLSAEFLIPNERIIEIEKYFEINR